MKLYLLIIDYRKVKQVSYLDNEQLYLIGYIMCYMDANIFED